VAGAAEAAGTVEEFSRDGAASRRSWRKKLSQRSQEFVGKYRRVEPGSYPPGAPTDPDVPN